VAEYRWNVSDFAAGFDASAEHIHPYYIELQDCVIDLLPFDANAPFLVIDAGGGSGRLVERFLDKFRAAEAIIIDQSAPFLALAERRLEKFADRIDCRQVRLQEDWTKQLPRQPSAIVSMSAIHHLDSSEKRQLYRRCFDALSQPGVLINADEVRPEDDNDYLARCKAWVAHKKRAMAAGLISASIHPALRQWEERNVGGFGKPRQSGDDCHETVRVQLEYLSQAGFQTVTCPWEKEMWAVLFAKTSE
jgi:SAM-dependent methyltransferase